MKQCVNFRGTTETMCPFDEQNTISHEQAYSSLDKVKEDGLSYIRITVIELKVTYVSERICFYIKPRQNADGNRPAAYRPNSV